MRAESWATLFIRLLQTRPLGPRTASPALPVPLPRSVPGSREQEIIDRYFYHLR